MAKNRFFTETTSSRKVTFFEHVQHLLEVFFGYIFIHLPYLYIGKPYVRLIAWLIGFIGPLSFAHKRVVDNLSLALPDISSMQKRSIAKNSWKNIAYIPYDYLLAKYRPDKLQIELIGAQHLEYLKNSYKNALFFSGHNACWEIFRIAAHQHQINTAIIYRPFNNQYFDKYARNLMNHGFAPIFQKNALGIRKMLKHMRQKNGHILMLTDQRISSGLPIPFFGQVALTPPSAAELAVKNKLPLIPIFVIRTDIGHYKVIIHPEIDRENKSIEEILTQMNQYIENHIKQYPNQWFWLHRRWKLHKI